MSHFMLSPFSPKLAQTNAIRNLARWRKLALAVWIYGWMVAACVTGISIAVNIITQGRPWVGSGLMAFVFFILLIVFVKEWLERFERKKAYYKVEGDEAKLLYTYLSFMRLPGDVRSRLIQQSNQVQAWVGDEAIRHALNEVVAQRTRWGRFKYRVIEWFWNFFD